MICAFLQFLAAVVLAGVVALRAAISVGASVANEDWTLEWADFTSPVVYASLFVVLSVILKKGVIRGPPWIAAVLDPIQGSRRMLQEQLGSIPGSLAAVHVRRTTTRTEREDKEVTVQTVLPPAAGATQVAAPAAGGGPKPRMKAFYAVLAFIGGVGQTLNGPAFGMGTSESGTRSPVFGDIPPAVTGTVFGGRLLFFAFAFGVSFVIMSLVMVGMAFIERSPRTGIRIRSRSKYPWVLWHPFGRGRTGYQIGRWTVGFSGLGFNLGPAGVLVDKGKPTGIASLTANAGPAWLAMYDWARGRRDREKEWKHPSTEGERYRISASRGFLYLGILVALAVAVQLVVWTTSVIPSFNHRLVAGVGLMIVFLVIGGIILGWLNAIMKIVGVKEEIVLAEVMPGYGTAGKLFCSFKTTAWYALVSFLFSGAAFWVDVWIEGMPTIVWANFWFPMLLLLTGLLSSQVLFQVANGLGDPSINGAMIMASLFATIPFDWLFQWQKPSAARVIGCSVALVLACAVVWGGSWVKRFKRVWNGPTVQARHDWWVRFYTGQVKFLEKHLDKARTAYQEAVDGLNQARSDYDAALVAADTAYEQLRAAPLSPDHIEREAEARRALRTALKDLDSLMRIEAEFRVLVDGFEERLVRTRGQLRRAEEAAAENRELESLAAETERRVEEALANLPTMSIPAVPVGAAAAGTAQAEPVTTPVPIVLPGSPVMPTPPPARPAPVPTTAPAAPAAEPVGVGASAPPPAGTTPSVEKQVDDLFAGLGY